MVTSLMMTAAAQGLLFAQADTPPDYSGGGGGGGGMIAMLAGGVFSLVMLVFSLIMIVGMWKIFTKAGKPGWASLVPIYNLVVMLEIVGKPIWWIALMLFCGPVGWIMLSLALAQSFGKETGFAIGLIVLPFIFLPVLGFGSAQYRGPAA